MYIGNEELDLKLTLIDSAQCFSWKETERGFVSVLEGSPVRIWREKDGIHAEGADEAFLRHYLDLDRDYAAIAEEYAHIPAARQAIALYPGLRVLKQAPWETVVSFILSANNNVVRIRKLVAGLCEGFGEAYELDGETLYSFPSPATLANCTEDSLRALGMGYRAPYLIETARQVAEGFPIEKLCCMEYEDAHQALTSLKGVGDKVADCVLLFGCGHTSAFPVDVWVEKLMQSWFGVCGCSRKKMMCMAREKLGEHAGLLQQFLFHAARMGDIEL